MILEEFDFEKDAIINPQDVVQKVSGMPKIAVSCFEANTFNRLIELLDVELLVVMKNANMGFPVYKTTYKGKEIALFMSDVGAAGAVGNLEEIYGMGVETVIVFGSCGVLDKGIEDCSIIIPNTAIRDEGASYHYMPASDEIEVNKKYIKEFTNLLDEYECKYIIGKTWTTDGFFRETKAKMAKRKEQGCVCVEMECSAMAAVAQFRGKEFFQFVYTADCLDGEAWDKRSLSNDVKFDEKDRFAQLALELAARI